MAVATGAVEMATVYSMIQETTAAAMAATGVKAVATVAVVTAPVRTSRTATNSRTSVLGNLEYVQGGPLVIYEAEQSIGDGLLLDIRINQVTDPSQSVGMADQGASGATITFNGEEVEFVGTSSASSLGWVGNLPYQFDGERRTFSTTLELTSDRESNECGDALREAAEHIVNSMELNAETTL
jgi:hypothetical protein